ncbi:MAG: UrcA family protein [Erythrobacter sp.]|nr:UrcA family protein [Erythrobacter sp.]
MRTTFTTALAALLMAGAPMPAAARTVSIEVSAADLDLTNDAHLAELEDRVAVAAREACERAPVYSVFASARQRACREELIERAAVQIAEMRTAAITAAHAS